MAQDSPAGLEEKTPSDRDLIVVLEFDETGQLRAPGRFRVRAENAIALNKGSLYRRPVREFARLPIGNPFRSWGRKRARLE